MTTLENRPRTALTVIDVQSGVVDHAHARDEVVGTIAGVVESARQAGVPVVWVQHSSEHLAKDSEPWQLVPELSRRDEEPVVHKTYADSFEDTTLEQVLAELGVGHLVVAGAQTDECIRSTIHGGVVRGYDVTLVEDAHTTEDQSEYGAPTPDKVIAHTNLYWKYHSAPGRTTTTKKAAELEW